MTKAQAMVSEISENETSADEISGHGSSRDHVPRHEVSGRLRQAKQGIDVTVPARIAGSTTVYRGSIFSVDDRLIVLRGTDGRETTIRRQVIVHAPSVVMLVHDQLHDRYILEREYRAGSNVFAYGLPAGLMDAGERPEHAALRELREETGVVPDTPEDLEIDHVGDCYSSEGMTDELVHIMVLHLANWHGTATEFDSDEYVASRWVDWQELLNTSIRESNAVIAIQHEMLRRLNAV